VRAQAIDNKDAAYVGSAPDDGITLLAAAKIPIFTTLNSSSNPSSFPTQGGLPVIFGSEGAALVSLGSKKLGIVHLDITSSTPIEEATRNATIGAGGKFVSDIIVTFQSVDVSAQVQQLKNSGADGVLLIATESVDAAFIRTMAQFGLGDMLVGVADGTLRQETLDSFGAQAKNIVAGAALPHVNVKGKNSPATAQYVKDMKAAGSFNGDNTAATVSPPGRDLRGGDGGQVDETARSPARRSSAPERLEGLRSADGRQLGTERERADRHNRAVDRHRVLHPVPATASGRPCPRATGPTSSP
jgi:hypothetical protein